MWKNNRFINGIVFYSDGTKYEGEWKNNMRSGKGKMTYKNNSVYEGNWRNNKKDGIGISYNL